MAGRKLFQKQNGHSGGGGGWSEKGKDQIERDKAAREAREEDRQKGEHEREEDEKDDE